MARARYSNLALTPSGVAVHIEPYAEVSVYDAGTASPYVDPIYAAESGATTLPNPFNADEFGNIEFYLDTPDELKLVVTGVGLGTRTLDYEPVNPRPQDMIAYTTGAAASIQARLDAGLPVLLPAGTFNISTTITLPIGGMIIGSGLDTKLVWTGAAGQPMFSYVAGAFTPSHVTIKDLWCQTLQSNITGIRCVLGGFEHISNIVFSGFMTPLYFDRGAHPYIEHITMTTLGANPSGKCFFGSTDQSVHLLVPVINGFFVYGEAASGDATSKIEFNRCAGGVFTNFGMNASNSTGILLTNDNQGVQISNGVMSGFNIGINFEADVAHASAVSTYISLTNVAVDQCKQTCVSIGGAGFIRFNGCDITNAGAIGPTVFNTNASAVTIGSYGPVARIDFTNCGIYGTQANGFVLLGGAATVAIKGCRFFDIGKSGAGVCVVIGADANPAITSNRITVADCEMPTEQIIPYGTIVDASNAGGVERRYINNMGAAPVIANQAGTVVIHDGQVQSDGIFLGKQIATPGTNTPTGYGALYQKSDGSWYKKIGAVETRMIDNLAESLTLGGLGAGFGIVQRIRRRDGGSPIAALGFGVTSAVEADVVKGAVAMRRVGGLGTGDILFLLDNNADTNDVAVTDLAAIIQGVPTAGPHVGSRFAFQYEDSSPMADASMPASSIHPWVEEGTNLLRFKVSYKDGTTYKTTTGLALT